MKIILTGARSATCAAAAMKITLRPVITVTDLFFMARSPEMASEQPGGNIEIQTREVNETDICF
jgi:hypothetical protein